MRPLASFTKEDAAGIVGLVTDLDDTVLDHGVLGRDAFDAIWQAKTAGFSIVVATGRPSGWGEVLARQWPVDGVVTENGAVAWRREEARLVRFETVSGTDRADRSARLRDLAKDVLAAFPDAAFADDVDLRRSDLTIDVGETRKLPRERVAAIERFARDRGARTAVSSVHLHLSFDGDDKASGTLRFLYRALGVDPSHARIAYAFAGDSGNDAACFSAFRTTFGVANVASAAAAMTIAPRFVAPSERGRGFAEIVTALVRHFVK